MNERISSSAPMLADTRALQDFCRKISFNPGDILRVQGQYYRSMYWLTEGHAKVDFDESFRVSRSAYVWAGWPVGEISFLHGRPAVATVTAVSAVSALILDDATLALLDREQPALAARLYRVLAAIAEDRSNANMTYTGPFVLSQSAGIDIRLCRGWEMLEAAQRLRYAVYCRELGRNSPYADDERQIISDALDDAGYIFVAVEGDEVIGTLRLNFASEGPLGVLEELYGMGRSSHHPSNTAVCTKFIIKRSKRRSPAAIKLIVAVARHCVLNGIAEIYIDSIPRLVPYYKAIGFKIAAPRFFHRENGPSHPMLIDVIKYKNRWIGGLGLRQYLHLYFKAKMIRVIDSFRGEAATGSGMKGASA